MFVIQALDGVDLPRRLRWEEHPRAGGDTTGLDIEMDLGGEGQGSDSGAEVGFQSFDIAFAPSQNLILNGVP